MAKAERNQMIPRTNNTLETEPKPGRAKIGKLQLNRETIKNLTVDDLKKVNGGLVVITIIGILIGPLLPVVGTEYCNPTKK